jgi:uncharacterized protein (DUF433 family)
MFDRITFDPKILGGRACIRGMRFTVAHLVNLVANGMTTEAILAEHPDLEAEDIHQALQYAAFMTREETYPLSAARR